MIFAEIKDNKCVNIIECDESHLNQLEGMYVVLPEGFGIGDNYIDNQWTNKLSKTEIAINIIDDEIKSIDAQGVTRHFENQVEAANTYDTIYETTRQLIDKKRTLRIERAELVKLL